MPDILVKAYDITYTHSNLSYFCNFSFLFIIIPKLESTSFVGFIIYKSYVYGNTFEHKHRVSVPSFIPRIQSFGALSTISNHGIKHTSAFVSCWKELLYEIKEFSTDVRFTFVKFL